MEKIKPGDIIGGCKIEEHVAQGGMGAVYRARQLSLERSVALKVLKPDMAASPEILKRFLREGNMVARLDHPGIVKIFDVGKDGDRYYLIMEFIEGKDLDRLIREKGPLVPGKALKITRQVAEALDYAHRRGIIHRDIKPSNIILARDGTVRITDFGVARLLEQETLITQPGDLLGTPVYMSPDQCRGSSIDSRSDLYNLGATLYALLSGKPPFTGRNTATLVKQILYENPKPLESLVPGLLASVAGLVKRLMAKHPAARYQTGKELCSAIDEIFQKRLTFAQDPASQEQEPWFSSRPTSRKHALITAGLACALGIGLYQGWLYLKDSWATSRIPAELGSAEESTKHGEEEAEEWEGEEDWENHEDWDRETVFTPPEPSESLADTGSEQPSPPDRMDRLLEERVTAFRDALLLGDEEEALKFVEPSRRDNSMLHHTLSTIVKKLGDLGPRANVRQTVKAEGEDKAKVVLVIRRDRRSPTIWIPLTWVKNSDGAWYIRPERVRVHFLKRRNERHWRRQ